MSGRQFTASGRPRKFRTPFDFRQRVQMARIYLDDGALLTCATRLEELARDIREFHKWQQEQLR